ncbi:uncharacterized protein SCHCODRAFT_02558372 [Schizophyllum commune H4-8]
MKPIFYRVEEDFKPWRCSDKFGLPVVHGSHITLVREGDRRVSVVPLADSRARSKRHRHPPSDEVVAEVAESIFQPGAVPDWYQVALQACAWGQLSSASHTVYDIGHIGVL